MLGNELKQPLKSKPLTLTAYWLLFRNELQALFAQLTTPQVLDKLYPMIQQIFKGEPEETLKAFHESLLEDIPQRSFNKAESQQVQRDTHDDDLLYLTYHLVAMRMAYEGARIESLPMITLGSRPSQKSVGEALDAYRSKFSSNLLPVVSSPATLSFAQIYLSHGQRFADGLVYAQDKVANKFLNGYIDEAKHNAQRLKLVIQQYVNANKPQAMVKKKLGVALAQKCLWLKDYEPLYCHFVEAFLKENTSEIPKEEKKPKSTYFWWLGWPRVLSYSWWWPAKESPEPIIKELQDVNVILLEEKMGKLETLIERLNRVATICAIASEFHMVPNEESTESNACVDLTHTAIICSELKIILRLMHDFYANLLLGLEKHDSVDTFTKFYFKAVKSAYQNIQEQLSKEHFEEKPILRMLPNFVRCLPTPDSHLQLWTQHFVHDFAQPDLFLNYFKRSGRNRAHQNHETQDSKPRKGLSEFFKNLKL